ncbi:IPTL-CTERM sorting domain-containing protein [Acidovorax sp. MR-S7]|uniref:IPTL-CTERM sorting domain-containing protein n=1 Tax=Acidovorax sp. MR-S7 TaxID=1268622 RepID=UPI0003662B46|nr:IPTL-CTERM sorting domain-containing protein [Acidovorax sp. MR-S7]GAD24097.1 hypothetical protein AVS7_03857 [Acidovorax sp. MR-S7]
MRTRTTTALLLACAASAAHAQAALNDTGQTLCYSNTGTTACSDPDFPGQDARYGRDAAQAAGQLPPKTGGGVAAFDFTAIASSGQPVNPSAGTHPCVRDNVTGLTWKVATVDGLDWTEGPAYAATHNACGYGDWRMPTRRELLSIANRAGAGPDGDYFTGTILLPAWTADAYAHAAGHAWYVLPTGGADFTVQTSTGPARYVRGAPAPAATFTIHPDGTATDAATALVWDRCHLGEDASVNTVCAEAAALPASHTWQQALQTVAQLNARPGGYRGHSDWRLPNVAELESLMDMAFAERSPSDQLAFPGNTAGNYYWSSTTYAAEATPVHAWYVNVLTGAVGAREKTDTLLVRLVRGGGPLAAFDALAAPPTPHNPSAPTATPVPTLGHAALALLSASVAGLGFWRRRRGGF